MRTLLYTVPLLDCLPMPEQGWHCRGCPADSLLPPGARQRRGLTREEACPASVASRGLIRCRQGRCPILLPGSEETLEQAPLDGEQIEKHGGRETGDRNRDTREREA